MLDNMVAGGIASGIGIFETLVKECQEEAGIPEALAKKAAPVGMIRCSIAKFTIYTINYCLLVNVDGDEKR